MKYKFLSFALLFLLFTCTQAVAQLAPKLQLNYQWTKPELSKEKKFQTAKTELPFTSASQSKRREKRFHIRIVEPKENASIEMPITSIDTSLHYHIRIMKLESPFKGEKKN